MPNMKNNKKVKILKQKNKTPQPIRFNRGNIRVPAL